jgi:PPOX class probable F420-dependent enzyme
MAKAEDISALQAGNYMSFSTRKRSGEFVATPVWFAPYEGSYYVFSAGNAGKVKRLRNFSESTVAPCTATGKVTGNALDTEAFVLETAEDEATALRALHRKYGVQMWVADFFSRLTGKMGKRAYIRVDLV